MRAAAVLLGLAACSGAPVVPDPAAADADAGAARPVAAEEKPVTEKPASEEPAGEKPAPEKPPAEHPAARKANRLAAEKSPYLLQHAHNPVDWYPWGTEAFEKARREDKPVFLSIGYSTCHWCHVMERESFENEAIAAYLNEHFVAIKVDREERPDVDDVYMAAVQALTGGGGWPLSVFLLPTGEPFVGGTYFPPEDDPRRGVGFLTVLQRVMEFWKTKRDALQEQGRQLTGAVAAEARAVKAGAALQPKALRAGYEAFARGFDDEHGGFGGLPRYAPKFPRTSTLDFLLRFAQTAGAAKDGGRERALAMVERTLDGMIRGGLRDHLAGGFHRYSTDRVWLVPHFEKMLYDQALITSTLCDAWRATGKEAYREAARETLDYVIARLSGPDGELYSAEDADTDGEEGKTYVWRRREIVEILGEERGRRFADFHGAPEAGNFEEGSEGACVLHVTLPGGVEELARKEGKPVEAIARELAEDRAALLRVRDRRPQPFRDDKVLVGWNGLAIAAFCQVYQVSGEEKYLTAARRAAGFILERLRRQDGRLARRWRHGEAAGMGFLDDHAFLVHGLLDLYESGFESRWLEAAERLGRDMVASFWDGEAGGFFSSSAEHEALVVRGKEFYDGAVPSGNAIAFLDLLRLVEITGAEAFRKPAAEMERLAAAVIAASPESHPAHLVAASFRLAGAREIVIAGGAGDPAARAMVGELHRRFLPAKVLLRVESAPAGEALAKLAPLVEGKFPPDGKATAYVCSDGVCKLPARDLETLRRQLEGE